MATPTSPTPLPRKKIYLKESVPEANPAMDDVAAEIRNIMERTTLSLSEPPHPKMAEGSDKCDAVQRFVANFKLIEEYSVLLEKQFKIATDALKAFKNCHIRLNTHILPSLPGVRG